MSRVILIAVVFAVPAAAHAAEPDKQALAGKVQKILKAACYRCHGENGAKEGGFGYVLNRDRLVSTKKVVPGDPIKSKLFKRISRTDDPMPPEGESPRPSPEDVKIIQEWIEVGAPDFAAAPVEQAFVSPEKMLEAMRDDLNTVAERDRRFVRYFTLTHLANAGASADELQSYRAGFSKLINSLSWGRRVSVPKPIDPAQTILRIDLRDYKWTEEVWDTILFANPYGVYYATAAERSLQEATGTRLPYVRSDWFVFAASRPPLYHDVLQLPKTDRQLEYLLQIDVATNVKQERVARAGFNGSGVSRNNRLIERHETAFGAYWKSYDFGSNAGRKNLFVVPLGPGTQANTFQHDGGELIFNLPNGLQGYLLVDAKGRRIDKGPLEIVSDPKQGDRRVVNGISCMSCHSQGVIEKADQIAEHVEKNARAFTKEERDKILTLYVPKEQFSKLLHEDAERFRLAVERTGAPLSATEPVVALSLHFEAELDLKQTAAEIGLRPSEFLARLDKDSFLARTFGAIRVEGGTVQRELFDEFFHELVRRLQVGKFAQRFRKPVAAEAPDVAPTAKRPLDVATHTMTVPSVDTPTDPKQNLSFRVELFLDQDRKHWIFLSEKGSIAVVPQTKAMNLKGELKDVQFINAKLRMADEVRAAPNAIKRHTIALKHDEISDTLIYISDTGSIAAFPGSKPAGTPKTLPHIARFSILVRKAGETVIDERTPEGHYEMFRDPLTDKLLVIGPYGSLCVTSGQLIDGFKYSPRLHGYTVKARRAWEASFNDATPTHGIEATQSRSFNLLLYMTQYGNLAMVQGKASLEPTQPLKWVTRLKLGVRLPGEDPLPNDNRYGSIEVYRDDNTGHFLYVSETGHIAAVPIR